MKIVPTTRRCTSRSSRLHRPLPAGTPKRTEGTQNSTAVDAMMFASREGARVSARGVLLSQCPTASGDAISSAVFLRGRRALFTLTLKPRRKGCYLQCQPTYSAKRGAPPCRGVLDYGAEALLARVPRPSWPRGAGPAGCATGPAPPPLRMAQRPSPRTSRERAPREGELARAGQAQGAEE